MELKDVTAPKWVFATKRGWGMALTFLASVLPFVNVFVKKYTGIEIDAPMVSLVGEAVTHLIDSVGLAVGVALWVWGSFRPTAPLTVMPTKAE